MVGAELVFADLEAALVERLGLGILAHGLVEVGQVVEAGGDVGVVGPELVFADLQAALVEGLGLGVLAHGPVEQGQVVEAGGRRLG